MKIRDFTVPELHHLKELCNFTAEEMQYFDLSSKDKSNTEISMAMNVSLPQVSKLAKRVRVKDKIKRVLKPV